MGVLHQFLDACRKVGVEFGRGDFLAFAVVLGFIVKVFAGGHAHFGGRERLFAFNVATACFFASNELFTEQTVRILEQVLGNLACFVQVLGDTDADGGTSQRVLDHERESEFIGNGHERVAGKVVLPDDAIRRSRDAVCLVDFLGLHLVHGECRGKEAATGVGNAPVFEHSLDVAVFAPFTVQGEEGDVGVGKFGKCRRLFAVSGSTFESAEVVHREVVLLVGGEFAGRPVPGAVLVDKDRVDIVTVRVHGADNAGATDNGNIMFGGRTTHQDQNAHTSHYKPL